MDFAQGQKTDAFPIERLVSTGGRWEVGIRPVIFGFRVCGGIIGSGCYAFDYCAGANRGFILQLLAVMIGILEQLPEETTEQQLQDLLPGWRVRPIDQDPCWDNLQNLYLELENGNRD